MKRKSCTQCGKIKPFTDYHKDSTKKDGLTCKCKRCRLAQSKRYRAIYSESIKSRQRAWYSSNKDVYREYRERNKLRIRSQRQRFYQQNKTVLNGKRKQWAINNADKVKKYSALYYRQNREAILARGRRWAIQNKEKHLAYRRKYEKSRRETGPAYKIKCVMSSAISTAVQYNKRGRSWESIVGYSLADLIAHLKLLFKEGMSLHNYGEWQIDHIIPLKCKNGDNYYWCQDELADPTSATFRRAWGLKNLQPLWRIDNNKKGDRYNPDYFIDSEEIIE